MFIQNIESQMDGILTALKNEPREVEGLPAKETFLANQEAKTSEQTPHRMCGKVKCDCSEQYEDSIVY